MPGWDSFAVIVGGVGGALVGLLFVAISIHAKQIAESPSLRCRAAQTLVVFAMLLLVAVVLVVPSQPHRVVGAELIVLAVGATILLIFLGRSAEDTAAENPLSRMLKRVNPNVTTALGIALTGLLLLTGARWAPYTLLPTTCVAIVGGLTSAYLLLTKLSE
jgi:ABC-type transport system involved in cytochrome c biogenesis permease subunit